MAISCINCGSPNADRDRGGDVLSCPDCGYMWDAQHEQQNVAYLKAIGRKPVVPRMNVGDMIGEPPVAEAELNAMTKVELIGHAALYSIEINELDLKAEVLAVIKAHWGY